MNLKPLKCKAAVLTAISEN